MRKHNIRRSPNVRDVRELTLVWELRDNRRDLGWTDERENRVLERVSMASVESAPWRLADLIPAASFCTQATRPVPLGAEAVSVWVARSSFPGNIRKHSPRMLGSRTR